MFAQAIHQSAGVGVGTFLGCLVVLTVLKRGGRDVSLLRDSVLFTSLVAGMLSWCLVAVLRTVLGV